MAGFAQQLRKTEFTIPADLRGQANGMVDPTLLREVPGGQMHHLAARAFIAMYTHARHDGVVLATRSMFRPLNVQKSLFLARYDRDGRCGNCKPCAGFGTRCNNCSGPIAACPGTSNHGWGLADDVASIRTGRGLREGDPELAWLEAHAWAYGFGWELVAEPWHLRYCTGDRLPEAVHEFEKGHPPRVTPLPDQEEEFLAALTEDEQREILEAVRDMVPTLIRKEGTTNATSVCILFRAAGVKVPLSNLKQVNHFKETLGVSRVISVPEWKYDLYRDLASI